MEDDHRDESIDDVESFDAPIGSVLWDEFGFFAALGIDVDEPTIEQAVEEAFNDAIECLNPMDSEVVTVVSDDDASTHISSRCGCPECVRREDGELTSSCESSEFGGIPRDAELLDGDEHAADEWLWDIMPESYSWPVNTIMQFHTEVSDAAAWHHLQVLRNRYHGRFDDYTEVDTIGEYARLNSERDRVLATRSILGFTYDLVEFLFMAKANEAATLTHATT